MIAFLVLAGALTVALAVVTTYMWVRGFLEALAPMLCGQRPPGAAMPHPH